MMQVVLPVRSPPGDALTCVRLDNGERVEGRAVWIQRKASGEL